LIKIPFYKRGNNIELFDTIQDIEIKITFNYHKTLKIEKKITINEWGSIKEFD